MLILVSWLLAVQSGLLSNNGALPCLCVIQNSLTRPQGPRQLILVMPVCLGPAKPDKQGPKQVAVPVLSVVPQRAASAAVHSSTSDAIVEKR